MAVNDNHSISISVCVSKINKAELFSVHTPGELLLPLGL